MAEAEVALAAVAADVAPAAKDVDARTAYIEQLKREAAGATSGGGVRRACDA